MPEAPLLNASPVDNAKANAISDWIAFVNQEQPLSEDAQIACDIIREIIKPPYQLRAFWHENYGQWWVHPKNSPSRQVGCVFPDAIEEQKAMRR